MIPSITHHSTPIAFTHGTTSSPITFPPNLSFSEKLKCIGLFDDQYHLQFTPSKIPRISETGQIRFSELMNKQVHCETTDSETIVILKESDYISGVKATLKEKGIETKTYLRGGYGAYVACVTDYFEFLIHEFLAFKNLPKNLFIKELNALKRLKEEAPHDVDLFDQVLNSNMTPELLKHYCMEYFKSLTTEKIQFLQKLIPEVSALFPYPEAYALFTIGTKEFQTDRIVGKLHHEYLYTRDDIRIEIKDGKVGIPESSGNFWQMIIDRKFRIVRTESWHEKDFRAGLAAIQLIHHDHLLIEEGCTLQSILRYAVSTGSDKILTGAIDRARLHCQNSFGFLLNVLIAYTHANPKADFSILTEAIQEKGDKIPPLASLYKLALLLTIYKDQAGTYRAEWDTCGKGLLMLYLKEHRIIFPKNFAVTSTERPFFASQISSWGKGALCPSSLNCVHKALDGELSCLERVLFELALQKPLTPLTEEMKEALVDYLTQDNTVPLADLFHPWFPVGKGQLGWVKALLCYSFKHGLRLWNDLDGKLRLAGLEEVIHLIAPERPNFSYALVGDEPISKELRLKLLKVIAKSPNLSHDLGRKMLNELILDGNPSHIPTIDRFITEEHEEWFFNSKPSEERIEAFYLKSKNLNVLIKGITHNQSLPLLQKYKNAIKTLPETYIKLIKVLHAESLTKEWIESFPQSERMNQILLFFTDYSPADHPLLDSICALPGLNEKKLLEMLSSKGHPVFSDRPFSKLMTFLKYEASPNFKKEILKILAKMPFNDKESTALQHWMKGNLDLSFDWAADLIEAEDHIPLARSHLTFLKTTKNPLSNDPRFLPLWLKILDPSLISRDLIPLYQDREWVKSIYGADAETKTKEWGKALIKQGNLDKIELAAIDNILSRTTLIHTPLARLKEFCNDISVKILEDMNESVYEDLITALCDQLPLDDKLQNQYLQLLFTAIKLGIASKLQTAEALIPLKDVLHYIPFIYENDHHFDPLLHFMQTLPLVDYGSKESYHEQNILKYNLIRSWEKIFASKQPCVRQLENYKIPTLPYPLMKAACEISHQFKLITGQYIENKATKEEFQIEVQAISQSAIQKFKSKELKPHQDPCLICIEDLSFLLKKGDKRTRAYEAFYYLLKQQPESPSILNQQNYLKVRKETEDLLIEKSKPLEKNKIVCAQYVKFFVIHFDSLFQSGRLQNLHIHDPIFDAIEVESISLFNKIELKQAYSTLLPLYTQQLFTPYLVDNLTSSIAFDLASIKEKPLGDYLICRIESLKKLKKSLSQEMFKDEFNMLTSRIGSLFSQEKQRTLIKYMEKTFSTKISYTITEK